MVRLNNAHRKEKEESKVRKNIKWKKKRTSCGVGGSSEQGLLGEPMGKIRIWQFKFKINAITRLVLII